MATRSQLSKYFNDGSREQVDLNLGQQQLDPRVTAGGQYRVAVQDTVRAEDTSAGRLASALQNISPALKAYSNINYQMGKNAAAAASPEELEEMLKKENPYAWLRHGQKKGVYDVGVKRDFNHNVLPVLKLKESSFLDVDTYKTPEELAQGIDEFEVEQWEQYQERLGEGMGNSLQAKAVWQAVFSEWRGGVESNHIKATNTYNLTGLEDEQHNILNAATEASKTNRTVLDHSSNIRGTLKRMTEQGSGYGLSKKDLNESSRGLFNSRAKTLINNGELVEAQRLLDAMNNYKIEGQNVFRTPENDLKISEMQKQITDGQDSAAKKAEARDEERYQNDFNYVVNNVVDVNDKGAMPELIKRWVNFGFVTDTEEDKEDFQKEVNAHIQVGSSPDEAVLQATSARVRNLPDDVRNDFIDLNNDYSDRQARLPSTPKTAISSTNVEETKRILQEYKAALARNSNDPQNTLSWLKNTGYTVDANILKDMTGLYNSASTKKGFIVDTQKKLEVFRDNLRALDVQNVNAGRIDSYIASVSSSQIEPIIERMVGETPEEQIESNKEIAEVIKTARTEFPTFYQSLTEINDYKSAKQGIPAQPQESKLETTSGESLDYSVLTGDTPTKLNARGVLSLGLPLYFPTEKPKDQLEAAEAKRAPEISKARQDLTKKIKNEAFNKNSEAKLVLAQSLRTQPFRLVDDTGAINLETLDMLNTSDSDLFDFGSMVPLGLETMADQEALTNAAFLAVTKRLNGQKLTEDDEKYYQFASNHGLILPSGEFSTDFAADLIVHLQSQ